MTSLSQAKLKREKILVKDTIFDQMAVVSTSHTVVRMHKFSARSIVRVEENLK